MLEIEMSKDIKNYEPKILGPFTMRQIVSVAVAFSYGTPIFILLHGTIEVRIMITLCAMVPAFLCGWLKVFDEPFEKFIMIIIRNKFLKPEKRKYIITNKFDENTDKKTEKIKRSKVERGYR